MNDYKSCPFQKAKRLQDDAAAQNFEWREIRDILDKCHEELSELEQAIQSGKKQDIEEELGDLLFVLANIGRNTNIDPVLALTKSNDKFSSRFNGMLSDAKNLDKAFYDLSLLEMQDLWKAQKTKP